MVVEHTFVTTLEPHQAMAAAAALLAQQGFESTRAAAFPIGQNDWNTLEMRRGKKKAVKARGAHDLPQRVRLDYDRGRVSVALSIEAIRQTFFTGSKDMEARSPKAKPYIELLTTIADALERLLAQQQPPAEAAAIWAALDARLADSARRRRRRTFIIGMIVVAVFSALMITLIVLANSR